MRKMLGIILLSVSCILLGLCAEGMRSDGVTLAAESNFPVLGKELLGEP